MIAASPELSSFTEAVYGPASLSYFFGALGWFVSSHFAYRAIHQLTQVSRIYDRHAQVRLGDLAPHFALSRLTGRIAICAILVVSGYMVGYAQLGSLSLTLLVLIPNLFLAGGSFRSTAEGCTSPTGGRAKPLAAGDNPTDGGRAGQAAPAGRTR